MCISCTFTLVLYMCTFVESLQNTEISRTQRHTDGGAGGMVIFFCKPFFKTIFVICFSCYKHLNYKYA